MTIQNILITLLNQYYNKYHKSLSKTKLLKLAYLVEIFYYRRKRERISDANWIYYLYGPWTDQYDNVISTYPFIIEPVQFDNENKEAKLIKLDEEYQDVPQLSFDEKSVILNIISRFGSKDLQDILDYVYFETEPMISALNRGEKLDFSTVLGEEHYKIKPLKVKKDFKKRFKKKHADELKNVGQL